MQLIAILKLRFNYFYHLSYL